MTVFVLDKFPLHTILKYRILVRDGASKGHGHPHADFFFVNTSLYYVDLTANFAKI